MSIFPGIGGFLPSGSPIEVLAVADYFGASAAAISQPFTCPPGTDMLIVAQAMGDDNNSTSRTWTSTTYNAVALSVTAANNAVSSNDSHRSRCAYMLNPPTGSALTFVSTITGSADKGHKDLIMAVRGVNHLAQTVNDAVPNFIGAITTTKPAFIVGSACVEGSTPTVSSATLDYLVSTLSGFSWALGYHIEPGPVTAKDFHITFSTASVGSGQFNAFDWV